MHRLAYTYCRRIAHLRIYLVFFFYTIWQNKRYFIKSRWLNKVLRASTPKFTHRHPTPSPASIALRLTLPARLLFAMVVIQSRSCTARRWIARWRHGRLTTPWRVAVARVFSECSDARRCSSLHDRQRRVADSTYTIRLQLQTHLSCSPQCSTECQPQETFSDSYRYWLRRN